ncbi:Nuclear transport factor 2-like [Crotalus adamanteus]|uniref:Nuclear transport factor 2-like n=1 Tax=Crotalus adamanteus TaxID=8729 RepID=A0AAW1BNT5_CROAD
MVLHKVCKMAERPMWEQIGTSFVQLYYQQFDTNREQLGALYVLIRITSIYHSEFQYIENIAKVLGGWTDASCLSWEGQQFQGKASIMEKLMTLPFQKIQHNITSQDHQPAPDNCILSMVVGQLKVDNDPVMGFHQMFVLKNMNDKWVCCNDIFRLALYNFA